MGSRFVDQGSNWEAIHPIERIAARGRPRVAVEAEEHGDSVLQPSDFSEMMPMRLRILSVLALLGGATACTIGKTAAGWPVAKQPQGATVSLQSGSTVLTAELIEVAPDGVGLKNRAGRLVFARFSVIDNRVAMSTDSEYTMGKRMPPTGVQRSRLQMVSHFPPGMTPQIRERMLAASGQTELEVLR